MTEERFLRGICERRHDPAAYGIFADWLEERGDPRAEYARLRGELAAICGDDPRYHEIVQRLQGKPSALSPEDDRHRRLLEREWELRRQFGEALAPWERRFGVERIRRLLELTRRELEPVSVYLIDREEELWPLHANPPLREDQLAEWERKHGIALPEAYRMFLLEIGNGGKMPSGFACQLDIYPLDEVEVGDRARVPFPLGTEQADLLSRRGFDRQKCQDPVLLAFFESERERRFEGGSPAGCLEVGIPNADYRAPAQLVVTGEQRGKVWAYRGGCLPERDVRSQPVEFLAWFEWVLEMDTIV